mmetsp:Transcript_22258/g.30494  ORF Transcript_22258/g.30494 Transcript_22258/m.30494 type:complete len:271 (+) Transcript_22258:1-813(+)
MDYEFDCLSFIDKEFDNPDIRSKVLSMIEAEMKTFTPNFDNYLSHLPPLPVSPFANSFALKGVYDRIAANQPNKEKLSEKRYLAEKPEPALENDVQAWKKCVQNCKSQIIHQENAIMNHQVAEDRVGELWLKQNSMLEKTIAMYKSKSDEVVKKVRECHKQRQKIQESSLPELSRLTVKRDQSVMRRLNCEAAMVHLEKELIKKGFNYEEYLEARKQQELQAADPNNAEYNSTVREYETVNVTVMGDDTVDENETEESLTKRQKHSPLVC